MTPARRKWPTLHVPSTRRKRTALHMASARRKWPALHVASARRKWPTLHMATARRERTALHVASARRERPTLHHNCGAIEIRSVCHREIPEPHRSRQHEQHKNNYRQTLVHRPPDGKLTRREYMYVGSVMEQNCYLVSKRSTPLDNAPGSAPANRYGAVPFVLSTSRVRFRIDTVNSTSVLLERGTKVLSFQ